MNQLAWRAIAAALGCVAGATAGVPGLAALVMVAIPLALAAVWASGLLAAFSWQGLWILQWFAPVGFGLAASAAILVTLTLTGSSSLTTSVSALLRRSPWLLTFVGALIVTDLVHPVSPLSVSRPGQVMYGIALFATLALILTDQRQRRWYLIGLAIIGVVAAVPEVSRVLAGGAVHAETVSFGMNPIDLARITGLAFVICLWGGMQARSSLARTFLLGTATLCLMGTMATGSRGPLAAALAALLWRLVARRSLGIMSKVAYGSLGLGILTYGASLFGGRALGQDSAPTSDRLEAWRVAASTALDHPIVGAGLGNYADGTKPLLEYPHNMFLQIGAELGLVAFIAICVLTYAAYRTGSGLDKMVLTYSIVCVSVSGYLGQSHLYWAALGLAMGTSLRRILRPEVDATSDRGVTA